MTKSTPINFNTIRVGCAGWSLPKEHAGRFPVDGSHLERYAAKFPAVEINSSFYRPHQPKTYARWAASVPDDFQFAVKMPKAITHEHRLIDTDDLLDRFLSEATGLGKKLGPLLVQLPPGLSFSDSVAKKFFGGLRDRFDGDIALEPRHASWFMALPERFMSTFRLARVAADPSVVSAASEPGGWDGLTYYRLHGSPVMYHSIYSDEYLDMLSAKLKAQTNSANIWCVFDNTADGAATANALDLLERVRS
ncbi:DUF72 domain-containing protein [Zavarzinella formosa]|uniref:DUF72 domain-containing protein n=1 Tax=Zavarzinella formosa TaxID=360055 RepID=UPI00031D9C76|nr:DUF72 domain-containing protein [Zavarzinella formosa]